VYIILSHAYCAKLSQESNLIGMSTCHRWYHDTQSNYMTSEQEPLSIVDSL